MRKSIYVIKNTINNKIYVGQSTNPHRRFIQHLSRGNCQKDNYPIHLAIAKYGKDCFYYEVIEKDIENFDEREKYWIAFYNSIVPNGYNMTEGGSGCVCIEKEHPRNTLSDEQVVQIINDLIYTNKTQRTIAAEQSCSERIINSINAGETRHDKNINYPIRDKFSHFSNLTFEEIVWLLQYTNASYQSIADFYNMTKANVEFINLGKTHKNNNLVYPIRDPKRKGIKCDIKELFKKKENVNK